MLRDAADLTFKAPQTPPAYDWSGFYVGGHVGYAGGSSDWTSTDPAGGAESERHARSLQRLRHIQGNRQLFRRPSEPATTTCCRPASSRRRGRRPRFQIRLPVQRRISTSAFAGTANFSDMVLAFGNRARPRRLRVRSLAALRNRRLRLDLRSDHPHAGRRRHRGCLAPSKPRCCGGSAGPRAPASRLPVAPHWTARLEYLFSDFGTPRRDLSGDAAMVQFRSSHAAGPAGT